MAGPGPRGLAASAGAVLFGACLALAGFAAPAAAQTWTDFGDDSGRWALDGECDDPRFEGPGMYGSILDDHRGHDATDCRAALDDGEVIMRDDIINFGDDAGRFALDDTCDDIRFEGEGMRKLLFGDHRGHDGADCRAAWDEGTVSLRVDNIVFGDDEAPYANDGECDDPRFQGPGMKPVASPRERRGRDGHDAADCRAAFLAGRIEPSIRDGLYDVPTASVYDGVDFGDNSSARSQDGFCDDPRFTGPGMAQEEPSPSDAMRDAADCASAYLAGQVARARD